MRNKAILGVGCVLLASAALAGSLPVPRAPSDADYAPVHPAEAALGQLLFYDPILSGNREVACATCHHPRFGTGDGLSLSLGDGGIGLGPARVADPDNLPEARVPRNAPALFNLGATEFTRMFDDGRIEVDATRPGGFRTPLDDDMVSGFNSLLSAQTMFPVVSADEMAGHIQENDVARAARQGLFTEKGGVWDIIARRVAAVPDYAQRFAAIYPHVQGPDDIAFTDISNAIAAFMAMEWRSDTAPFDAYLRGQGDLPDDAMRGLAVFYGEGECARCHAGPFLTDHDFHAMGAAQIGPGKAAKFERHSRDEGRFRVTGDPADMYAFRTPSLRNVALTAPYGHAGAHGDLAGFIRDHADPGHGLAGYDISQAVLPALPYEDTTIMSDPGEVAAIAAAARWSVTLSAAQISELVAFLETLTDPQAMTGGFGVPDSVPSGLAVPH